MSDTRPNLILITTDQHRGDCLGADGHPVLQTPNLDELCTDGIRFRRGATECPSCFPARRTLMAGCSPAAQGMVGMRGEPEWKPPHTFAGELTKAGYQTKLVGKLHLQPSGKRFGFEHQELADASFDTDSEYGRWLQRTHGRKEVEPAWTHGVNANGWVGRPGILGEDQTHTYWCIERAIEFLENQRDPTAPFFLNISIFDPHPPLIPPRWYYDRYVDRDLPGPYVGDWAKKDDPGKRPGHRIAAPRVHLTDDQQRYCEAAYYGTVNYIDDQIGRLLIYLTRKRLYTNTMIAFTSDHGEMLGDQHMFRKCWPYEGSTRVPFIIKPPSDWNAHGLVSDAPVGLQDLMPTFLEAAGAPVPDTCNGKSLCNLINGSEKSVRDYLHIEDCGTYASIDGYHAIQNSTHKYVWYSQRDTEHLFDLENDPKELKDLAAGKGAEKRLKPWRDQLAKMIANRPEGFVENGQLVRGKKHEHYVPGHQPDLIRPEFV